MSRPGVQLSASVGWMVLGVGTGMAASSVAAGMSTRDTKSGRLPISSCSLLLSLSEKLEKLWR